MRPLHARARHSLPLLAFISYIPVAAGAEFVRSRTHCLLLGLPMKKTLNLIVFTPRPLLELGRHIQRRIEELARNEVHDISVTVWDNMFDPINNFPLNECIRKLHSFDGAIIVLGPDQGRSGYLSRWLSRRPPINPNVLIEIGASMARFGRKRVFLLKPRSESIAIPSYFASNNVLFETYDDTVEPGPSAVAVAASRIVQEFGRLGQSAYYSDLPAFGLAHGYFYNFVKRAIERVEKGDTVEIGGKPYTFSSAVFIVAIPEDRIVPGREGNAHLKERGLVEGTIKTTDGGRPITFTTIPRFMDRDTLYIVEVPGNLNPALDAIENIEQLWIDRDPNVRSEEQSRAVPSFPELLVHREIASFSRYIDLLREKARLDAGKVRLIVVRSLERITLELIEQHAT
jgi:nucleotide-binding STING sensor domain-containing protein/predicted nucleotide-binding protein with TIR-like domain